MGSFVAREYITRYKDLDGVLLSGTGGSNPAAGAMSAMIRTMIPLKGEKYRSDWINEKVFGGFNQAFPEEPSPFAWLSRDAAEVAEYEADPDVWICIHAVGVCGSDEADQPGIR